VNHTDDALTADRAGHLVRVATATGPQWAVRDDGGGLRALPEPLADLLARPVLEARRVVEAAQADGPPLDSTGALLPPVDSQEVWAAGVTYRRSRDGRTEE
jgi:2-dehydro-3-deoxy-D-arabinonate dehydratase